MGVLRVSQFAEQADTFRVELSLDGAPPVRTRFQFAISPQDQEDIRWYLEDYLLYPLDPAPTIAARIEEHMKSIGEDLFRKMFDSGDTARRMWARLQPGLNDTRVEISTEVMHATAIPWELLLDPLTDQSLALRARSFVRVQSDQAQPPKLPARSEGKIRILLVICRPKAGADVPFRSVASRIVKSLSDEAREFVQLDVLRPPTFEQLGKTLREAKTRGESYHVVHFDGHGTYEEFIPPKGGKSEKEYAKFVQELLKRLNSITLGTPRAGKHGYLLFENPQTDENMIFVDGHTLGGLLVETDVPTLVLNACQSAYAEAPSVPPTAGESTTQDQLKAFGSLAQEVMDTGVAGVVAMRYVLYVETAKRFVADLYAALAQGQSLGEAVTFGRKQLATNPQREIAYKPINLQDWAVPIVYEAAPIELFPRIGAIHESPLRITVDKEMTQRGKEIGLPPRPDVGFFGRDETLLALDRAFDSQHVVLLHAFAGSGKTTTAVEFARWYALTGGVEGALFFTSFEHRKTLTDTLNETIGREFNDALEQSGVHWLTLTDEERRTVALQVMQQVPILWIWDNVEPIAGFPTGTEPVCNKEEREELRRFLSDARETKAKFLLTSRRDERGWLSDLPRRICVPPMPMQERVQLARALAEKVGRRITDVEDWRPLLQFTQGNPLTITVVVGEALCKGLKTKLEIGDFIELLRKGENAFADEQSEGRSKSLGASLSYGFENAFTETERKQLALLYFFQGFVDAKALLLMGNSEDAHAVSELRDLTPQGCIALLDRAAEIGLLTAHGGGYYSIHPALPWYFKSLFDKYYNSPLPMGGGNGVRVTRAFVNAMGELGNYYAEQYERGNRDVIGVLTVEEANLLHARQTARANRWWGCVISTMQGLRSLYGHTGRRAEWARLVNEIVPDFVDPSSDGPRPGREEQWSLVTEYRVLLAEEERQWTEAERLQRARVQWNRRRAAPALTVPAEKLDDAQRNKIRTLAASLHELGEIRRELGQRECVQVYEESADLLHRIGDKPGEAVAAFNLGRAYGGVSVPTLRDLAQAERWYRRSLELCDERDRLGRSKTVDQIGMVIHQRFREARKSGESNEKLLQLANEAADAYRQSLDWAPPDAVDKLAISHIHLADIFDETGLLDRALPHYREAIHYDELAGNIYGAAQDRFNVAIALANAGRLADAREYALASLRNYETFGDRAVAEIEKTKQLLADIEKAMRDQGG